MPAKRTKKVGPAGRFGARYGFSVRKRWAEIERERVKKHECPVCGKKGTVKRIAPGIWYCRKCETKFAGNAYWPGVD